MSFFSGPPPPVPRPVRERLIHLVNCHNYDDSWICGCFIEEERKAETLAGKLNEQAKKIRKPGYDPQYYVDTFKDGEVRD